MIMMKRFRAQIVLCFACSLILFASVSAYAQVKITAATKKAGTVLYSSPEGNSESIASLDKGEQVVVQDWKQSGMCQVMYGDKKGFIAVDQLDKLSEYESFDPALKGKISADDVNMRLKPDIGSDKVDILKKGTLIDVISRENNWYKVAIGNTIGYVSSEYISLPEIKEDGSKFIELKMGMSGKEIVKMQFALSELGYYQHQCNGNFGSRTRDALKRFQHDNNLKDDGIADTATLKALYEKVGQ